MVSTGSHTSRTRIFSPFIILTTIGLLVGGVLASALSLLFEGAPQTAQDGIWLLGIGIGQTLAAIFGARIARVAMWQVLLIGQIIAIVGLLLAFSTLF